MPRHTHFSLPRFLVLASRDETKIRRKAAELDRDSISHDVQVVETRDLNWLRIYDRNFIFTALLSAV